jgi:uncharacterized protein YjbI with pentapeptide repeats
MASEVHLQIIRQGVIVWNKWRRKNPELIPNLVEAHLSGADLGGVFRTGPPPHSLQDLNEADPNEADLSRGPVAGHFVGVDLNGADLSRARLDGVNLSSAHLPGASLIQANLFEADLREANLIGSHLSDAHLGRANLDGADLRRASLEGAKLPGANLHRANLSGANLSGANLSEANLSEANLSEADLSRADFNGADLAGADLAGALLIQTDLCGASLAGSNVYGASVWDIKVDDRTKQQNLVITPYGEAAITVENIKVAQFIYLLLNNREIREVIDTVGKKGVLLLGRFTGGRIAVLERLREELRKRDFLAMVFNFDKPEVKDFTETVRLLAGLSRFVIVDITNPRSAPLELQATVPEYMIPFVPIIEKGEEPFAMFTDLWIKHREWVLDPIRYPSVDRLIEVLDTEIVRPAQARFADLLVRKAEKLRVRDI